MHISLSCNAGIAWKLTANNYAHSVSRLRSYLQRMRISKCLPPQDSLDISLWEGMRLLLFFNAFMYKLLNMIAIKSPFVKEFRYFSETLKSYTRPKLFIM